MKSLRNMMLAAVLLASVSVPASADLIGDSVHGRYLTPNTSTVFFDAGTQTIANGTVFNFGAAAATTATFTNTEITVTNTGGSYAIEPFNGIDLAFLTGSAITSVVEDPSSSSLFAPGSVLTFTANDIMLNLSGTCPCVAGTSYSIVLDVTTAAAAAVPEPASLTLLGTALAGLCLICRRKRG